MSVITVGVELEGAYDKKRLNKLSSTQTDNRSLRIGTDGTAWVNENDVDGDETDWDEIENGRELRFYGTLEQTLKDIKTYYPDYVSSRCGGHIHVSFETRGEYMRLMTRAFYSYFKKRILEWANAVLTKEELSLFMPRYEGENGYCADFFCPEKQIRGDGHHAQEWDKKGNTDRDVRYSVLNYCIRKHGTLECRLMPMFVDYKTYQKAVTEVVSIYNDFLEAHPNLLSFRQNLNIKQSSNPDEITEVIRICV